MIFEGLLRRFWGETTQQIAENKRTGQKPESMSWEDWCNPRRRGYFFGPVAECHWYDPPELTSPGHCRGDLDHDHQKRFMKWYWRGPGRAIAPLYWAVQFRRWWRLDGRRR